MIETKQVKKLGQIGRENLDLESIPGMTTSKINTLYKAGIKSVVYLACHTVNQLTSIGIAPSVAQDLIIRACRITDNYMIGRFGFVTGDVLLKKYDEVLTLSSGCPSIDEILDGGFRTQKLYDVYGKEGTGKSSLMHQLICRSFLPIEVGGLGSPAAIYIDTEGSFNLNRIKKIAPFYHLDPVEVLKKIYRAMPPTSDVLSYVCMNQLNPIMEQTGARIVVIDSLSTPFLCEYGDERLLIREMVRKIYSIINCLKNMAVNNNALVLITNYTADNPTGYMPLYINALKVHAKYTTHYVIRLSSHREKEKKFVLEKSVDLPNKECPVMLTEFGLQEMRKNNKLKRKRAMIKEDELDDKSKEYDELEL